MAEVVNVLSLGAGVQSSALLLMFHHGEITPPLDFAVFADTQCEPAYVYEWLANLKAIVEPKIPILIGTRGNLADDFLNSPTKTNYLPIPLWGVKDDDGGKGLGHRQCTKEYKIEVVQKVIRQKLGYKPGQWMKHEIHLNIGISIDEATRMRMSRFHNQMNVYPLIEASTSRHGCREYIKSLNIGTPPRSACWLCPFRSNQEWLDMKQNDPESFQKAVKWDERIRHHQKGVTKFVHSEYVPLSDANLEDDSSQLDLFQNDCQGMCGV